MGYDKRFPRAICPICNTVSFSTLSEQPPAVRCMTCGLGIELSVSDTPRSVYGPKDYDATRNGGEGGNRWSRFHHDCAIASARVEQVNSVLSKIAPENKIWVDIGTGNGALLTQARRQGWKPYAIEYDERTCDDLTAILGIHSVTYGDWLSGKATLPPPSVISFFDVLEHLLDPTAAISAASVDLCPGGVLIVEVPDLDSLTGSFNSWKHRRVTSTFTEHQYHFNESSLRKLIATYANRLVPMHVEHPIEGHLQMAFRNGDAPHSSAMRDIRMDSIINQLSLSLMSMPEDVRRSAMNTMRNDNPGLATEVEKKMAESINTCMNK